VRRAGDKQRRHLIAIGIRVVAEYAPFNADVFVCDKHVIGRDRRIIDRIDRYGDGCGRGPAIPVIGLVGELVDAVEVRVRRVGERAVGVEKQVPLSGPSTSDAVSLSPRRRCH
jgi:hypothetical protein